MRDQTRSSHRHKQQTILMGELFFPELVIEAQIAPKNRAYRVNEHQASSVLPQYDRDNNLGGKLYFMSGSHNN